MMIHCSQNDTQDDTARNWGSSSLLDEDAKKKKLIDEEATFSNWDTVSTDVRTLIFRLNDSLLASSYASLSFSIARRLDSCTKKYDYV